MLIHRYNSFAPILGPDTQLLILGSLPGAKSLKAGQYYAHPQNQFWRLLDHVARLHLMESEYSNRIETLLLHNIGLWDVIESASRKGSLDSDIKNAAPQDLLGLIKRQPKLRAIGFNGGKASQLGRLILGEQGMVLTIDQDDLFAGNIPGHMSQPIHLINLPSSSAANTQSFDQKAAAWSALAPYVTDA